MPTIKEDKTREYRIDNEIVVDAYGEVERAMGWYCYLDGKLTFPFKARCISTRPISPLSKGEKVEVVAMAPEEESEREMLVEIKWQRRRFAVPLSQVEGVGIDEETKEGIGDWHYWVKRGYEL